MVLEKFDLASGRLVNDLVGVRLSEPPVGLTGFSVQSGDWLNYVMLAPTGPRFFVHTTRIIENQRGTNPIIVVDAETGVHGEVTAKYFSSASPGFTLAGLGMVTYGYSDETGTHGVEWLAAADPPTQASPVSLVGTTGMPVRGGILTPDGTAWFGISGMNSGEFATWTGPIDLERFDFAPGYIGPTHLARLSEYANVDNWLFAPDASALVYRVVVTSSQFAAADPLTKGHYTSELGTYWASTASGAPTRLGVAWSAYDGLTWLPDAQGLLRVGPKNSISVVTDATLSTGQGVDYANQGTQNVGATNSPSSSRRSRAARISPERRPVARGRMRRGSCLNSSTKASPPRVSTYGMPHSTITSSPRSRRSSRPKSFTSRFEESR
jgi:hypothetical protein